MRTVAAPRLDPAGGLAWREQRTSLAAAREWLARGRASPNTTAATGERHGICPELSRRRCSGPAPLFLLLPAHAAAQRPASSIRHPAPTSRVVVVVVAASCLRRWSDSRAAVASAPSARQMASLKQ